MGDFGLARDVTSTKVTELSFGGTLIYMSPEILTYKGGGMPSDMWAVGVCMHQLLSETGGSPWGEGLNYDAQIKGEFTRLPSYVPKELQLVVSKLLDSDPVTRMTC